MQRYSVTQGEGPDPLDILLSDPAEQAAVWEFRWHEEQTFANRLSFYMLAQSFLVIGAVTAMAASSGRRLVVVALAIELVAFALTVLFWYVFTENVRMLYAVTAGVDAFHPALKEMRVRHHNARSSRPIFRLLLRRTPTQALSSLISILFGVLWIAMVVITCIILAT